MRVNMTQPKEILKRTLKRKVEKVFPKAARNTYREQQRLEEERKRAEIYEAELVALFATKKKKKKVKQPLASNE